MGDNNGIVVDYGHKSGSNLVWPVRTGRCDNAAVCLPKTGQTICYNTYGNFGVIPCSGTGQEGKRGRMELRRLVSPGLNPGSLIMEGL